MAKEGARHESREKGDGKKGRRAQRGVYVSREGGNERKIVWSRYRFARVARDGNDPADVPSRFASAVAVERFAYFSSLSTPPGSDRRHPSARTHLGVPSSFNHRCRMTREELGEINATTRHEEGDEDGEKAIVKLDVPPGYR